MTLGLSGFWCVFVGEKGRDGGNNSDYVKANLRWEECPWVVVMLSWVKCLLFGKRTWVQTLNTLQIRGGGKCCVGQRQADPWSLLTSQFSQLVSSGFSERPCCLNKVESEDTWCQPLVFIQIVHIHYTHMHSLSHKRTILFFFSFFVSVSDIKTLYCR